MPTNNLNVPAKLVGMEMIVLVQNLKTTVKMAFMIKFALKMVNANVESVNVIQMNSVENFARRKQILFVRPWGLASWEKLNTLTTLTKSALKVTRRIDLAKTFINSVKRKTKNQRRHIISMSLMQMNVVTMVMLQLAPRIALLWLKELVEVNQMWEELAKCPTTPQVAIMNIHLKMGIVKSKFTIPNWTLMTIMKRRP